MLKANLDAAKYIPLPVGFKNLFCQIAVQDLRGVQALVPDWAHEARGEPARGLRARPAYPERPDTRQLLTPGNCAISFLRSKQPRSPAQRVRG